METQYNKISENEIEVVKPAPVMEVVTSTYERSFIENQIVTITADRDEYVAKRNAEIAECEVIKGQMDKMNIVSKIEIIQINEVAQEAIII